MGAKTKILNQAFFPSAIAASIAIGLHLLPSAQALLIYDRDKIADGEWWRLYSSHWIHFSGGHLLMDLMGLIAALFLIRQTERGLIPTFLLLPWFIGLILYWGAPDMILFGGLSGMAVALLVRAALERCSGNGWIPLISIAALILLLGKVLLDLISQYHQAGSPLPGEVRTAALAHLAGVCWAFLWWSLDAFKSWRDDLAPTSSFRPPW